MTRFANNHSAHRGGHGFTLIELCMVIALIATLMAIALPRFLPAISYSSLEGAALHLGHYGRAAMAQAVLSREQLTVTIDLDKQEYKTIHRVEEVVTDTSGANGQNKSNTGPSGSAASLVRSTLGQSSTPALSDEAAMKAEQMQASFDSFTRLALQARAKNVEQDGILSDIGPLFEKEFTLDAKGEDKKYQDVSSPLLEATTLPDNARIESVHFGGKDYVKGVVKIDISPLGLSEPVEFYVRSEDGDYYSVLWDAITGEAIVAEGRQSLQ